ncbi:hypothetical protein PAMP_017749 [Pampus punctatissimus]
MGKQLNSKRAVMIVGRTPAAVSHQGEWMERKQLIIIMSSLNQQYEDKVHPCKPH